MQFLCYGMSPSHFQNPVSCRARKRDVEKSRNFIIACRGKKYSNHHYDISISQFKQFRFNIAALLLNIFFPSDKIQSNRARQMEEMNSVNLHNLQYYILESSAIRRFDEAKLEFTSSAGGGISTRTEFGIDKYSVMQIPVFIYRTRKLCCSRLTNPFPPNSSYLVQSISMNGRRIHFHAIVAVISTYLSLMFPALSRKSFCTALRREQWKLSPKTTISPTNNMFTCDNERFIDDGLSILLVAVDIARICDEYSR